LDDEDETQSDFGPKGVDQQYISTIQFNQISFYYNPRKYHCVFGFFNYMSECSD
jgi:hypothetical protein